MEDFLRGIDALIDGMITLTRNMTAWVNVVDSGHRPKPVEIHKLKGELATRLAELEEAQASVRSLFSNPDAPEAVSATQAASVTGPRDLRVVAEQGSLLNASTRQDYLTAVAQLRAALRGYQNGMRGVATMLAGWQAGVKPSSGELAERRSTMAEAADGIGNLMGIVDGIEQQIKLIAIAQGERS